jgi:hypothetical protein
MPLNKEEILKELDNLEGTVLGDSHPEVHKLIVDYLFKSFRFIEMPPLPENEFVVHLMMNIEGKKWELACSNKNEFLYIDLDNLKRSFTRALERSE